MKREQFLSRLRESRRKRISLERVTAVFMGVFDEYGDHPNYREPLALLLAALEEEGSLALPKGKHLWETIGIPKLPLWVEVVSREVVKKEAKPVAWLPELAPVAAQLLQQAQRHDLAKINAYLIANRGKLMPVPYRERSLKIFGDEHYMDQMVCKGRLFQGRLSLDTVYAFEVGEPMPYERPPSLVTGKPVLIVENHHSFASFVQVNAKGDCFSAICFASGHTLASREYALESLGAKLDTQEYLYLGDIDPSGLSIPIDVNATRRERGVPLLKPAMPLYRWLLRYGKATPLRKRQPPVDMRNVAEWFAHDPSVTEAVDALLSKGLRIPQESLGLEDLTLLEFPAHGMERHERMPGERPA